MGVKGEGVEPGKKTINTAPQDTRSPSKYPVSDTRVCLVSCRGREPDATWPTRLRQPSRPPDHPPRPADQPANQPGHRCSRPDLPPFSLLLIHLHLFPFHIQFLSFSSSSYFLHLVFPSLTFTSFFHLPSRRYTLLHLQFLLHSLVLISLHLHLHLFSLSSLSSSIFPYSIFINFHGSFPHFLTFILESFTFPHVLTPTPFTFIIFFVPFSFIHPQTIHHL